MTMLRHGRHTIGLLVSLGAVAAPLATQPLTMLSRVEPGLWSIKAEGEGEREICAADPSRLVQVKHDEMACTRLVIANSPTAATVHYSCPGAGWGRTTIKFSTPRSVTLDTQGIANNAPFAFAATARRIGDCKPGASVTAAAR